jgi:dTDP-4-dehydrorhamnose reductase
MRIMITGAAGMLGRDLVLVLSAPATGHDLCLVDLENCDITRAGAVRRLVEEARPEAIVHAAAWTDVDGCERDPERAMLANGEGTRNVALAAQDAGAHLLYISTDYVFDGEKRQPYDECDPPNPRSSYGRSKLAGERAARQCPGSLVLRTAWMYGEHGRNFVAAVLGQTRRGETLRVVDDQVGCPTWSLELAQVIAALLRTGAEGLVHAAGSGCCSWYEFALAIVQEAGAIAGLPPVPVEPIRTTELNRAAPRPAFSVLGQRRLTELGIPPLPDWRDSLHRYLLRVL